MSDHSQAVPAAEVSDAKNKPSRNNRKPGIGRGFNIALGACAVAVVVGICLWMTQLTGGMVQTGMRNLDSWGLYITNFMFFVGLSAGGLIISSVPNAFGLSGFGHISKVAIMTSIACTCVAVGFVVVDLGGPMRLWELFVFSNFTSPLMWDIIVLSTYLILSILYLWAHMRFEAGALPKLALRVISVVALIVAICVHTVTAWIFSLAPAHDFWHTALMGPWFVASALDCGTALVLIVVLALRKFGYLKLEQRNVVNLSKMLAVFVLVDLYFFACDLLTSGYFGQEAYVVEMLLSGQLAPFFWSQIACMVVAVLLLVVPRLRTDFGVVAAAVLTITGVFCKRCQILLGGFQISNLDSYAQLSTPFSITNWQDGVMGAYQSLIYWPQPIEFGVTLGVVALGVLIFLLGFKFLPLCDEN